jgi:NhaP-type Na+/H+ or K+/H+ antiporter
MLAGIFGLVGIMFCLLIADAFEKGSGGRVALFLSAAVVCFGISIAGISTTPAYLESCDDYSRFASSC